MTNSPSGPNTSQVDLDNCAREPIHIPSTIQTFGAVIAFDAESLSVEQVSGNIQEILGVTPEQIVESKVSQSLDPSLSEAIVRALQCETLEANPVQIYKGPSQSGVEVNGQLHTYHGVAILDLELSDDSNLPSADFLPVIKKSLFRLEQATDLEDFCRCLADEYRTIVGFDRVMVYRFLPDSSGEVIGESLASELDPFLGLRYPASDIPEQARKLFLANPTRVIQDPSYQPVPIQPILNPRTGLPLDLCYSALRGVSPIHCEYLRNMGVGSSMSQALTVDGKLWGLISSHSRKPQVASYSVRSAMEFLTKSASLLIETMVRRQESAYRSGADRRLEVISQALSGSSAIQSALIELNFPISDYVEADGCAVSLAGDLMLFGDTPLRSAIVKALEWLADETADPIFATTNYSGNPSAPPLGDGWAGLLSVNLTRHPTNSVIWFKRETMETVSWAGNPSKPVVKTPDGDRLNPRKSFELYRETVRGRSAEWTQSQLEAARKLRVPLVEALLRNAEETARRNVRLSRSNDELDSFAYMASHDLKEPLRGIRNYSTFLYEDYSEVLDEPGRERLLALGRLSARMETLTDSLLHYSRLGRQELELESIPLEELIEEAIENTRARLEETGVKVRIQPNLPLVVADRNQLIEVFQNLISNAAKYNLGPDPWIEIGVRPHSSGGESKTYPFDIYVQDNGIGISPKHFESIFRIFKRLHSREEFGGGSGAGLTIARKIIERHHGNLWVESVLGQGSTFALTLERNELGFRKKMVSRENIPGGDDVRERR